MIITLEDTGMLMLLGVGQVLLDLVHLSLLFNALDGKVLQSSEVGGTSNFLCTKAYNKDPF